jgi:hypothetical protein
MKDKKVFEKIMPENVKNFNPAINHKLLHFLTVKGLN